MAISTKLTENTKWQKKSKNTLFEKLKGCTQIMTENDAVFSKMTSNWQKQQKLAQMLKCSKTMKYGQTWPNNQKLPQSYNNCNTCP